jgi:hypothetical protein
MDNNKILFETKKLDCGCEFILNDYEIMKLDYCDEHIFEKYRFGDFSFLKSKKVMELEEYCRKLTEMRLWSFLIVKKTGKKKFKRRRWRFIQIEFRPLYKYFWDKERRYSHYIFRRNLKLMKKICKLGWSEYVKKTIDQQRKKINKKILNLIHNEDQNDDQNEDQNDDQNDEETEEVEEIE